MQLLEALRTFDDDELAALLTARPDLVERPPTSMAALAERCGAWPSVKACVARLDAFALDLAQAVCLVPDGAVVDDVAALLGPAVGPADLDAGLERLRRLALVGRDGPRLHLLGSLRLALRHPGRLGSPLVELLERQSREDLARVAAQLGLPRAQRKSVLVASIVGNLTTPGRVDELLAGAPAEAVALVRQLDAASPLLRLPPGYWWAGGSPRNELDWLIVHGLLVRLDWSLAELPREVGLALRGGVAIPGIAPRRPPVETVPAAPDLVERAAAEAAGSAIAAVQALVEEWDANPASLLKAGGVGVRDLRRTAKAADIDEDLCARLIELAAGTGLVGVAADGRTVLPTGAADEWLGADPAVRWVALVKGWMGLDRHLGMAGLDDGGGKPLAPLLAQAGGQAVAQRRSVLEAIAGVPEGQAAGGGVAAHVSWEAPLLGGDGPVPPSTAVDWVLEEAALLGVTGAAAVCRAGRALCLGDDAAALDAAREMLPAPTSAFTLQADLTAVAAGALETSVGRELAAMADVESKGAATVFRFSEASVRRAVDTGRTAAEMLDFLERGATRGVPQPLSYLIADVGRRHGAVRVGGAGSYVRSDDPALLAEVLRCRGASRLGLRRLAPTVLVSSRSTADVLAALRAAGFLPAEESAAGAVLTGAPTRLRAPVPRRWPPTVGGPPAPPAPDPVRVAELVARLRAAPLPTGARRPAAEAAVRRPPSRHPSPPSVDASIVDDYDGIVELLSEAVECGAVVEIGYGDSRGRYTERTVEPVDVGPDALVAHCHLRDDERNFVLERIEWARMVSA